MAYVLPVFPALSILAGISLVWIFEYIQARWEKRMAIGIAAVILSIQVIICLIYFPYHGTHHNLLLGGSQVAQHILPLQDNGEGLDLAGQYLNDLPYSQGKTAMLHPRSASVFDREFDGNTITSVIPWADFRIYYVNQLVRGINEDEGWGDWWEKDSQTEPLHVIEFDGVPYVWIYGEVANDPVVGGVKLDADHQIDIHISLIEAELAQNEIRAGDKLLLELVWISDGEVGEDLTVFTHVTNEDGKIGGPTR